MIVVMISMRCACGLFFDDPDLEAEIAIRIDIVADDYRLVLHGFLGL